MGTLFLSSIRNFRSHGAQRFSAAIAYYMIFCLAPLFVFALSILTVFLNDPSLNLTFFSALQQLFGKEASGFLQENLQPSSTENSFLVLGVGLFFGLAGASAVFKELKCGLNTIFEVRLPKRNPLNLVVHNLVTFSTVLIIGLFLIMSVLSTMAVSVLSTYFKDTIALTTGLIETLNFGFSFVVLTAFFMVLYTFVPDTKTPFRLTLLGSIVTALLFVLGKTLFGYYLTTIGIRSGYGAAGSILVLLVWIFYSAQIFFFGAELTAHIKKNRDLFKKIL